MRSFIYHYKSLGVPPIPHSLAELAATLQSEQWAHWNLLLNDAEQRPYFQQLLGGEEMGWTAAVYVSHRMIAALVGTQRLHMDATFKTLPQELRAYQMLSTYAEHMNHVR